MESLFEAAEGKDLSESWLESPEDQEHAGSDVSAPLLGAFAGAAVLGAGGLALSRGAGNRCLSQKVMSGAGNRCRSQKAMPTNIPSPVAERSQVTQPVQNMQPTNPIQVLVGSARTAWGEAVPATPKNTRASHTQPSQKTQDTNPIRVLVGSARAASGEAVPATPQSTKALHTQPSQRPQYTNPIRVLVNSARAAWGEAAPATPQSTMAPRTQPCQKMQHTNPVQVLVSPARAASGSPVRQLPGQLSMEDIDEDDIPSVAASPWPSSQRLFDGLADSSNTPAAALRTLRATLARTPTGVAAGQWLASMIISPTASGARLPEVPQQEPLKPEEDVDTVSLPNSARLHRRSPHSQRTGRRMAWQ